MRLIDADAAEKYWSEVLNILRYCDDYAKGFQAGLKAILERPTIEAEPVRHGRWEWFEEWNPSTPDHPRECEDCGWRCSECKTALEDVVGGYWDNPDEEPKLYYCPNCGVRMDKEVHPYSNTRKDWPPYMDFPRKSSVNVCAGCVHEATNKGSFPCDECKRKLRGEHDLFVEKVKEK